MQESPENSIALGRIVKQFGPIHLNEMDKVSLMDRVDTKFVFHRELLPEILEKAHDQYKVLEIDGKRMMGYKNQYFDTRDKQFYKDHHNGKGNRTKVRIRAYLDSDIHYLEVKQKSNKGRTKKKRKKITGFQDALSAPAKNFINLHLSSNELLSPTLWNTFQRMTLVNTGTQERATFDTGLRFGNGQEERAMNNLAIVELKQAHFNRESFLFQILKKKAIHPYKISKYCIGLVCLDKNLKYNLFKEKLLRINKIMAA